MQQVQKNKKQVRAGKPQKGSRAHRSDSEAESQTKYATGVLLQIKINLKKQLSSPPYEAGECSSSGLPADQANPTQHPGAVQTGNPQQGRAAMHARLSSSLDGAIYVELYLSSIHAY